MATVLQEGAKALPLQQLLNSYFAILLNPGKGALNREATGPLNCPAERTAGPQDLGLPRNLLPTPAGWGRRQQPRRSPCPRLKTAGNLVQEGTRPV